MTDDVAQAILLLQRRSDRVFASSPYWTECYDRALDELVRNSHQTGNPGYLARNAVSNAAKILKRRNELCVVVDNIDEVSSDERPAQGVSTLEDPIAQHAYFLVEFRDWLTRTPLSPDDRTVLKLYLATDDEAFLACHLGLPVQQTRVRLSRARRRARQAWAAA